MPTFLVNPKMDRALAARIEASVTGKRTDAVSRSGPRRALALARFALPVALVLAVYSAVSTHRAARAELEATRSALLAAAPMSALTPRDRATVDRATKWITLLANAWGGELAPAPGVLAALGHRSTVYVRGAVETLRTPEQVPAAAALSRKDGFLVCLRDPPAARTEAEAMKKVHVVNAGGGAVEEVTANVSRLDDAIAALPVLSLPFAERIRAAEDANELAKLRKEIERVPLDRALRALRAELLLVVLDEHGDANAPTELDGERPHGMRIALIDLDADRPVLMTRRHVDPSWISMARRPLHARALDSCVVAFDLARGK